MKRWSPPGEAPPPPRTPPWGPPAFDLIGPKARGREGADPGGAVVGPLGRLFHCIPKDCYTCKVVAVHSCHEAAFSACKYHWQADAGQVHQLRVRNRWTLSYQCGYDEPSAPHELISNPFPKAPPDPLQMRKDFQVKRKVYLSLSGGY